MTFAGAEKPDIPELPRVSDRISFVYLEYCRVSRKDNAVEVSNTKGTIYIPSSAISTVLLGPGTSITHRAIELLGDCGATVVWTGERGIRYYAHGRALTHSSLLLEAQAKAVSNRRSRLAIARRMYQMRFPGEDVSHLTMQQLRGREGARIRKAYREISADTGVEWNGRRYDPNDYSSGDCVNKALSTANSCMYGIVHSVISALGCSPGLGFIHTGHEKSFVYDIADLYKTEITIPTAFRVASTEPDNVSAQTRRAMRDAMSSGKILYRTAHDIRTLLLGQTEDDEESDELMLWDEDGFVPSSTDYSETT